MSDSKKWTPAQKSAINSLDGTILVSAAAGSGKTSVLVERIIERITNPQNPSSVDRLLVVTFTKAAAAEMKNRLSDAISKLIEKDPSNVFLKRQKLYLSEAQICTMDSFCARLVKDNFESLSISPDFTMLSDSENKIVLSDTADEILSEIYENGNEDDVRLLELFTNQRNDDTLKSLFIKMYDLAMADFDPEQWIDSAFMPYFEDLPLEESACGKYMLSCLCEQIYFILEKIDRVILDATGSGKLESAVNADLSVPEAVLKSVLDKIDGNAPWDDIRDTLAGISFKSFQRFSEEEKDSLYYEIKARRDLIKKDTDALETVLVCTAEDYYSDIKYLRPVMLALKNRVKQFIRRIAEVKAERNSYYFTDILHFALDLLYEKNESGETVETNLAKELSGEFDEILIDEFQDTNEAQVSLFNAVSKDGNNQFIVGDVKQSIYAFRQACPEIFVSLLGKTPRFVGKNYPAKIYLDSNFRSRKGVVDAVNFFFDFLMIPNLGGLNYKETERLRFSAVGFNENTAADAEVHIVEAEDSRASNFVKESQYIGGLIQKMISSKMLVGSNGNEHPVQYSDICILLRAVKDKANVMAGELANMGIPVHYKKEGGFFDNAEIMTVISMLRVIDSPLSDIPLLSVLLSPLTAFTEDDVAELKTEYPHMSLYSALKANADKNDKAKQFLEMLSYFRTLSVTLCVADLIRRIYEITAFDCVVSAMDGGERRALNLQKLVSFAENYNSGGNFGLSGFLRYIDKLQKNGLDLEGAETVSENDNAVRIMTYHKSKGLEFPVVILANMSAKFRDESKEKLPVNKTLGAGALRFIPDENREIKTQIYSAVIKKNEDENTAENLRLLYVAMTRAKEKLILVGSVYNPQKRIENLYYENFVSEENMHTAIKNINSFFDWVLFALIKHPSFSEFSFVKNLTGRIKTDTESKIDVHFCESFENTVINEKTEDEFLPDRELTEIINQKVSYAYPFDLLAGIDVKYTASSMDREERNEYFASDNPAFLSEGKITPAKRGTLIHKFMEVCDMKKAAENLDGEIERLTCDGTFTGNEANAVQREKIKKFFKSDMFRRICEADEFWREREFTMSVPLKAIHQNTDIADDESAVVQGVVDGFIVNGNAGEIIDYKTDRVKSAEELCERYKTQMWVYKRAAEECFGVKNVKVTLYSFELSQEISVNFEKTLDF